MKESYKSFDELPMMLSVSQVAKVLGISRTRSYELVNEKSFPKIKRQRVTALNIPDQKHSNADNPLP